MIGLLAAAIPAAACAKPAKAAELKIYKSPYCGCCGAWVDHVQASGLPTIVQDMDDVTPVADRLGVPDAMRSCHTAEIGGYFVEGHVPVTDIRKLLIERPKARGIAVPGMPIGSPGMEQGERREAFDTMLVLSDGSTRAFVKHSRSVGRS
ncbi:MAG TPA: DUF411 domain-containing protein [Xanthobacteraceae bacterium]|nr:DUF411 domain-containing protein [Xanthobacteraceae bacterium]